MNHNKELSLRVLLLEIIKMGILHYVRMKRECSAPTVVSFIGYLLVAWVS